ncbi:hypothetical protein Tco_0974265 [Tanacetum coccineum]|uniref:Uncharacterized protein n=1 Tax=Tanacetum coccineum TaxID=301880 RepID=A0ABQ5EB42_9ASTR
MSATKRPNTQFNFLSWSLTTVEDPLLKDDKLEDIQAISDSSILKLSKNTEKKEKNLYSTLGVGVCCSGMQGFTGSEIIRILAGQLNTVAAMADFTLVEVSYGLKRLESDNDVVLDYFTLMVTLESNSDVTSPRSNNLSTSNHVSLDSRHWIPSSGGLRALRHWSGSNEMLKRARLWLNSELEKKLIKNTRQMKNLEDDVYSFGFINDAHL